MEGMNNLEKVLKALANRRRLALVAMLYKQKKVCVTDAAQILGLSVKATSKHLNILRQAGIAERTQVSLLAYYSLALSLSPLARSILPHISNSRELENS